MDDNVIESDMTHLSKVREWQVQKGYIFFILFLITSYNLDFSFNFRLDWMKVSQQNKSKTKMFYMFILMWNC